MLCSLRVWKIMCLFYLFLGCFLELNMYGSSVVANPIINHNERETPNRLVFPDSEEVVLSVPKCHNRTFCENPEDYPSETFHRILESKPYSTRYSQYFQKLKQNEQILKTRSHKANQNFVCPSVKSIVYPKAAYNVKDEIKFIYNLPSYRQGVAIEVCVKQCKCRFYEKSKHFRTMCKQKFAERLLLAADSDGRPYVDRFKFPSTCVCTYKSEKSYSHFSRLYKL